MAVVYELVESRGIRVHGYGRGMVTVVLSPAWGPDAGARRCLGSPKTSPDIVRARAPERTLALMVERRELFNANLRVPSTRPSFLEEAQPASGSLEDTMLSIQSCAAHCAPSTAILHEELCAFGFDGGSGMCPAVVHPELFGSGRLLDLAQTSHIRTKTAFRSHTIISTRFSATRTSGPVPEASRGG